jgi:hypothetical protein
MVLAQTRVGGGDGMAHHWHDVDASRGNPAGRRDQATDREHGGQQHNSEAEHRGVRTQHPAPPERRGALARKALIRRQMWSCGRDH